jgi:hypothetical protein
MFYGDKDQPVPKAQQGLRSAVGIYGVFRRLVPIRPTGQSTEPITDAAGRAARVRGLAPAPTLAAPRPTGRPPRY